MLGIGASGPVWPAAGPAAMARRAGAKVAILNPDDELSPRSERPKVRRM
jgi:hypothetical protein